MATAATIVEMTAKVSTSAPMVPITEKSTAKSVINSIKIPTPKRRGTPAAGLSQRRPKARLTAGAFRLAASWAAANCRTTRCLG